MNIRILTEADAKIYREIRLRALKEDPEAFGSTYAQSLQRSIEWFAERIKSKPDGSFTLGAFEQKQLIGTVGLGRSDGENFAHKGVIWGMYVAPEFRSLNVPIGIAGLLLGAFTLTVRREAVPLLIGLLAMENGAFLCGIAIARNLPLLVELAIATDGLIIVFIMGVLTRAVQKQIGTTAVGELASLKEATIEPAEKEVVK